MEDQDIRQKLAGVLQILREQETRIGELEANREVLLEVLRSLLPAFDDAYQVQSKDENGDASPDNPSRQLEIIDHAIDQLSSPKGSQQ